MTPKEQYEARKAARKADREASNGYRDDKADFDAFMDIADRFVTAIERIADAMEAKR